MAGMRRRDMMLGVARRYRWVFILRGVLAIIFGIAAWVWPDLTIGTLVIVFGIYAIIDGILAIRAAIVAGEGGRWLPFLLVGLAGIGFGIVSILWPGLAATTVLYLIATWAIIVGIFQAIAAIQARREIDNEWFLVITGIGAVIWGILVWIFPGGGALAIIWTIGVFAIAFGILLIAFGLRLRNWNGRGPVPTAF
jgi:uncharacterized membrane protein HdeD (DUF308 family)